MSLEISRETEIRLVDEARRQGVSVDVLLERLIGELGTAAEATGTGSMAELPALHLGPMGALHRRDIYDDGR
jgi:hypothetical protein